MGKRAAAVSGPAVPAGGSMVGDVAEVADSELVGLLDEVGIEARIKEWAARENPECLTVRTYIYKYDNPSSGDLKVLCDRIDEEIPDPHSVGLMYGAGRYMMIVSIPNGANQEKKMRGLRFRLHARYDELRKGAAAAPVAVPAAVPAVSVSPAAAMSEGLGMVAKVIELLTPILAAKQAAAPAAPDMSKILEGQYDMMSGILRKSLADSQELIGEVHKARLEGSSDPEAEEPDFITKAMPLIQQFLPLILKGGGAAEATAAAVRGIPEVAKIVADRHELGRVVAWLDKSQGVEKTDRILGALKVRRPGVARVVAPGANGKSVAPRSAPVLPRVAVAGARG